MATWTPDPSFYPSPRMAMQAPAETLAYVAAFDPARKQPDGIAVVDVDPKSSSYSQDRRHGLGAECRRRVPPLRLERLLVVPVPAGAASARGAALSGGAGPALLAHLHPRHQARPAQTEAREDDRAARDRGEDRIHPPAHHPLRARAASTSRRSAIRTARRPAASS